MKRNELIEALERGETGWKLDGWIMAVVKNRSEPFLANLTTSLDAALALLAEVLPGWNFRVQSYEQKTTFKVDLYPPGEPHNEEFYDVGCAPTPAAALLIAILKAMEPKS